MKTKHLFFALATMLLSSITMPALAQKSKLLTKVDSLSYAIGVSHSQGFLSYLKDELKVDLNYLDDFAKGMRQTSVPGLSGKRQKAYNTGKEMREQMAEKIPEINKIVFGEKTTRSISSDLYFEGFLGLVTGKGALMTYDTGAELVNRLIPVVKAETEASSSTVTANTDILCNLTFESGNKYVRPKGAWVALKQKPNAKSGDVRIGTGDHAFTATLSEWEMTPVKGEKQGYYNVGYGWVKKSDVKVCVNKPITAEMMNTNQAGMSEDMDLWSTYRVYAPVGSQKLAVAHTTSNGMEYLRLGKLIDNVFVFKYVVLAGIYIDEENPNRFDVGKELRDGELIMTLNVGTKYCVRLTPGIMNYETRKYDTQPWALDLSKLNDKVLLYFFKDAILNNKEDYLYLNSELLTGEYANFFM